MKSGFAAALAVLVLAAPVAATDTADMGGAPGARIKATMTFLADDLLEGRGIGTRGHEIAARYVAAQFALLGLETAGSDGYYQRINFQERSFASSAETLTLALPGGSRVLTNGAELNVPPGTAAGPESIEAPLVFVGYGIIAPALGIDDYAGIDVRGKIVVTLSGAPKSLNGEIAAHLARAKGQSAAAGGAIGMISVRTLAQAARAPWAKSVGGARLPRRNWIAPDGAPDADAGALRFSASIDDDAATALFAAAPRSFATVRAEADAGAPKGFALPGSAKLLRDTAIKTISSPNILARLPGSDPSLTDQLVLLSAHLDHLGIRPGNKGDQIYNGALDNSSGVATLLEVARQFASERKAPRRSLLFLVTTGEEGGLMGSGYFARHPTVAIKRIVSEVNIDMPILTCNFADVIAYGADRSTMGPMVAAAATKLKLTLSPDPQPIEALFTRSDHYPLVRAGVPAVFLKTGWHDIKGGMACRDADDYFRRNHYHEPSDDLSQPIDWAAATKFAAINTEISRTIANAKTPPRWYKGDYFGAIFAADAEKADR